MSNAASGANVTRLFNPDVDTHYAISESNELELKTLFKALDAIGFLMDTPPGQIAPEIEPHHIAPIFQSLARQGERIMAECADRYPSSKRKSA